MKKIVARSQLVFSLFFPDFEKMSVTHTRNTELLGVYDSIIGESNENPKSIRLMRFGFDENSGFPCLKDVPSKQNVIFTRLEVGKDVFFSHEEAKAALVGVLKERRSQLDSAIEGVEKSQAKEGGDD